MTEQECTQRLGEICRAIANQNRELMRDMDKDDFDPAIRLDNTKNNAAYKLTDFFDILKCFPYGHTPHEPTDELVSTTDELLHKIRAKYGGHPDVLREIIRTGQAFRNSKRIWRIENPIKALDQTAYAGMLDDALCQILRALDDLNYELNLMTMKPSRKRRGRFYGEKNALLHKDRAAVVAEMRRRKSEDGISWTKIIAEMRRNSSYTARLRGKTDATWIRYAKSGFSG